ncbi:MAG TPA: PAS domain-containing protein, partial [bacterium]|nr:PAS domain-containing protein [bacterium]
MSSILRPAPSPVVGIDHPRLLSEIIENLPPGGETAALGRELQSLARESDLELLAEGLLSLASRQVHAGRSENAATVYPALQRLAESPALPAALRQRIEGQLAGFQGQGSVGQKVERHVQNFFHEAMHPAMLAGFAFGAGAFQSARLLALSWLSAGSAGFLTRGFGARFVGGAAGWAAEVPALTIGSRGVRALMGERVEWSGQALGHELGSTAITLGLMRAAGYGARRGFETVHGLPASGQSLRWSGALPFSGPALQQGAMLGSLMLAHDIEARLGLRTATDLAGNFSESLLALFQFQVGGRIFHEIQPRVLARAIQTAEHQSQNLSGPRFSLPRSGASALVSPVSLRTALAGPAFRPELSDVLTMAELPRRSPADQGVPMALRPQSRIAPKLFKFRNVVEELPDPVFVTDATGRVVYLNRVARELVEGTPLNWLQGKLEEVFRPVENEEGVFTFSKGSNDTSYWRIRSQLIDEGDVYRMHQLSDLTQLRHWQEVAAISEMKVNLAEGLVHDAGNMVASA